MVVYCELVGMLETRRRWAVAYGTIATLLSVLFSLLFISHCAVALILYTVQ